MQGCTGAVQVAHQGPATLGIALVALSEELGTSMAHRALEHLLQYGEPSVRCTHTLVLSLLAAKAPCLCLVPSEF